MLQAYAALRVFYPVKGSFNALHAGAQVIGLDGFKCGRKALDRVFAEGHTQACLGFTAWQAIIYLRILHLGTAELSKGQG
ncbi:hypothetical protein N9D47_05575 [Planktomarina temperata]|nr:hypothetical protein [Planktomarina temperata]